MKILLVALNSQYVHLNLAVRYLKHYTDDLDYNCTIREFTINNRLEQILQEIMLEKADVICFSTYIWNISMVKDLGELIKKIDSSIEVLYGGPEVSFDTEEFFINSRADYVIVGEGEETYKEFVEYKLGEKNLNDIKGLYYKSLAKVYFNGARENIDMNDIIFPYDAKEDLENKIIYYESSRGCPFRCKYCLSSTDRNLRFLPLQRVKDELKYFIDKKVKLVKFVDRTFNAKREFAIGIWEYLIENDNGITCFHFEISSDILKDKEFYILKKARKGLFQFEIGVQSTNCDTLRDINRMVTFSDIKEKVLKLKECNNIKQHLDLIAGLPNEDYESFMNSFNEVYALKPDEIQLGFLKVLKGTQMKDETKKWGLVYSHLPPYEILKTKFISYEEIIKLKKVEELVDKYYNSGKFINIINYFEKQYEKPFIFYEDLSKFADAKGYFSRSITCADYYKLFLEFNRELLNGSEKENLLLKNIIKLDFLLNNKKSWVPDFLATHTVKEEINEIKEKFLNMYPTYRKNKIYIIKFDCDIENYIKNNVIIGVEQYMVFAQNLYFFIEK